VSVSTGSLKRLIQDFFKAHEARLSKTEAGLSVNLADPKEIEEGAESPLQKLREVFGRDHLNLVFDAEAQVPDGADLVIEGGHILRVIEEFLSNRGSRVYVEQPATSRLTKSLIQEKFETKKELSIESIEREALDCWDFYFLFKIHFKGATRKDSLLSVKVESRGAEIQLVDVKNAPRAVQEWNWKSRKQPPIAIMEAAHQRACSFMEQKTSFAALEFQKESRAQIDKDILRIKSFYGGQIKDLWGNKTPTDKARTRIVELEEEQIRKVTERLSAIAVHVEVETAQLMIVDIPFQQAAVTLKKGTVSGSLSFAFNRATGEVDHPDCPSCSKELKALDICSAAHVNCSDCVETCRCETEVCNVCGYNNCAVCQHPTCSVCLEKCGHCGENNCRDHHKSCSTCNEARCDVCVRPCKVCEKIICLGCGQFHHVGEQDELALCSSCGNTCQSCKSLHLTSELDRCSICGRRFCLACLDINKQCKPCVIPE
jgi:hypothetical protein